MAKKTDLLKRKSGSFDWDNVHQWISTLENNIREIWTPGPDEKERILKERARILAIEEDEDLRKGESLTVLEFMLAYEHYAVEIIHIQEILRIHELTPLPGAPSFVLGIINIRGIIYSIIDLKRKFGLPDRGLPQFNTVIILSNTTMKFGVVIDSVIGIRQILTSTLKPPPVILSENQAEYVKGVTADPIIILDGKMILEDRNLVVNEQR